MKKPGPIYRICIMSVIAMAALLPGCDNSMDPFDEEKGSFSIYGYLDIHEEQNYIRIKDINQPHRSDATEAIDAVVTLENIYTGITETLEDSTVEFDGVFTHNFRTTMDITPDTRYRVTAERSDGVTKTVTATTPPIANVTVEPTGENCLTPIELILEPVHDRNDISLEIGFTLNDHRFWVRMQPDIPGMQNDNSEDDLFYLLFAPIDILDEVFNPPFGGGERRWCHELDTDQLYVRYTHFGPDFFDETASDSAGVVDIPGGTERFGGLYNDSFSITIDTSKICPPGCD